MSIILISAPAFSYVTNSSHCDNDVLSTYSGSANLTANWQGNPITVTWYNDDTQYDSNQCTYGGNLTMPSSIPQKTGYTFRGWRVRQAACDLSTLDPTINASWDFDHIAWKPIEGNGVGYDLQYAYWEEDIYFNIDNPNWQSQSFESVERSGGLNNGEWEIIFSYGTVKGMAKCSETNGDHATVGNPSDTLGQYCWCAVTGYTPNSGNTCSVAALSWVFYSGAYADTCLFYCAFDCAASIGPRWGDGTNFRRAVFGIGQ